MRSPLPRYLLIALFVVAGLVLPVRHASAQMSVDPLEFDYEYPRLGGEIGLSSIWQTGTYLSGCGVFKEGARLNPFVALAFDYPLVQKMIRLEALVGFQWRSLSSVYNSQENVVLQTSGGSTRVNVDFENRGTASISYIYLMPGFKFYPTSGLYVGAGLSVGLLSGAKTQYTKTILSRTVLIPDVGLSEVSYAEDESSDPYSKVFPEEDLAGASSLALDATFSVGAEFKISRTLKIGPRLMYALPLSTVTSDPELKLGGLHFLVGARFDLFTH